MNKSHPATCLSSIIQDFLEHWRALGRGYRSEERVLWSLNDFVALSSSRDLDLSTFEQWCAYQKETLGPTSLRSYQQIVRKFCLYRTRTLDHGFVPDPHFFSKRRAPLLPYIFKPEDIHRVLAKCSELKATSSSPLFPDGLRLAVILLYTAGLRIGELIRLTLSDIVIAEELIRINQSKFHKSRMVPLSPGTFQEVSRFLEKRVAPSFDSSPGSALLGSYVRGVWREYTDQGLRLGIKKALRSAHVVGPDGRCPRVHDFRHSFAVQALLRWYRTGADVQSKLPVLAHYMGHVSIASTAYYLQWLPDIATEASRRFEDYAGLLVNPGGVL